MKTGELTKQMKQAGCRFVEHRGEHDMWYSPITGKNIMIPRHPSKEIPNGTVQKIKKDSGLK